MTSRPKPDPARGVFTTMLVVDGTPVAPVAHLARLEASMEAVYGASLPAATAERVEEGARGLELGRLRLTFAPGTGGLGLEATELDRSLHFPARPVFLVAHQVSGGLGAHKWVDRASLPAAEPGEAPLLVDGDEVLEAAWANVFAVRSGALFTPPLDGRILPGVTRATIVELACDQGVELTERPLRIEELEQADEVFLTNSTRGIEEVGELDGAPLGDERPLTLRLGEALRLAWKRETAARRRPLAIDR
ncbi:MAG TPA: aminotransferase class IV [Solirubrobacterales bacterium]|nr:aminotransferase class IV [Solirubrobacterales bacterium]